MEEKRLGELSLSLTVPAKKNYVDNILLTLDGLCEHCNARDEVSKKAKETLELALNETLNEINSSLNGLFDLNFKIENAIISISVDNSICGESEAVNESNEKIRERIALISCQTDNFKFTKTHDGRISYLMQFNL